MEKIEILTTAIITAFGTGLGAFMFSLFQKFGKKRDEKVLTRLDNINDCLNLMLRYSLHQGNVLTTILDAMKSNHINGNIERAENVLTMANNELQEGLQKALTNRD